MTVGLHVMLVEWKTLIIERLDIFQLKIEKVLLIETFLLKRKNKYTRRGDRNEKNNN